MKILNCFLLFLILLPTSLVAQDKIRITNGEWPPYLSQKLPHYGYASHLVKEAFSAVGVEVEYGFFPWRRSFEYARNGKDFTDEEIWHGTIVWVYTEERAKEFLYTDVAITETEMLFYLKSSPLKWGNR